MSSGVPQGSVLGPALFTLFINDITKCIKHYTIRLFADDTLLYAAVHSDVDMANMQSDLDKLYRWSIEMKFNALKSNVIAFGGKLDEPSPKYHLSGQLLASVQSVKYLGVYLSYVMKWSCHIDYTTNKALRVLGLIKHVIYDAPEKVRLLAYVTLCRPL